MKRMVSLVWLCVIALLAATPGFAAPPDFLFGRQAHMETVGTPRDASARAEEMQKLQDRLATRQVKEALNQPVVVRLTAAERRQIDNPGPGLERRYMVGLAKPVGMAVDFSPARSLGKGVAALALGAARGTGDGFVWTAEVRVPGATALRLHLTGLDLPQGAELYVYNYAGHAFGPYTGRGPLGDGVLHTNTVFGDRLLLQLNSPGDSERAPKLTLEQVGVMGARFSAPRFGPRGAIEFSNDSDDSRGVITENALCSGNAACVVNAACQSHAAVDTAKDAVASILFLSGGSYYICTGGLLADTVSTSVIPFFLTANHCISRSSEASSLETYFDYVTTCSNPNCTQPYNNTGDTVGATLLANGTSSDYSLLRLSSTPVSADGVTTYLGWLTTAVANTNNLALYRISHPSGAPQAYTEGVVDTSKTTCRTLPRGSYIYSRDTLGATEGGSSGSPVVNSSGQVVGQLYGACGFNLNDVCDAASNATVDGAFAASYPSLAPFLNPGTGGCSAAGASCTSGSQCCSGNCKGKVCR